MLLAPQPAPGKGPPSGPVSADTGNISRGWKRTSRKAQGCSNFAPKEPKEPFGHSPAAALGKNRWDISFMEGMRKG